jgi:hypothetical protein
MVRFFLCFVLLSLSSAAGLAQDQGVPPAPPPMTPSLQTAVGGRVGVGMIDEDLFVNLSVGSTFAFGKIKFGVHVPLRIRAWDRKPEDKDVIRKEDWDEWQEYFRVLRFFQYGEPDDLFYLRVGELVAASLGHGTIVHRYYNNLDFDHFSLGFDTRLNFREAGGEVLTNDLLNPELVALRGFIRPMTLWDHGKGEIYDRLAVGLTFATDVQAPWSLRTIDDGAGGELPRVDRFGNLSYARAVATLWGIDLGWTVVKTEIFDLTPYMDFNFLAAKGFGWHPGVMMTVRPAEKTWIEMRFEYRALTKRYAPSYFNSFYDFQRTQTFPQAGAGPYDHALWRHWSEGALPGDVRHGFFGELYAALFGVIGIGGLYEDYTGRNNSNVMLRADFPYVANLKLAAYYAKRNFNEAKELFELDGAWLVAEARYRFIQWMYAFAVYSSHWEMVKDKASPRHGKYDSIHDFQVGIGAEITF